MIPILYEPFRHWTENGSVYILSDLHWDGDEKNNLIERAIEKGLKNAENTRKNRV